MERSTFSRVYKFKIALQLARGLVTARNEMRKAAEMKVGREPVDEEGFVEDTPEGLEAYQQWCERIEEKRWEEYRWSLVVEHYQTLQGMLIDDDKPELGLWAAVYVDPSMEDDRSKKKQRQQ
mmetsp:Transcript_17531/g.35072  ORF Transcript_17531/g.35072 Transcript_17531/m.35072 type:complete len:122 (+) Transcript_17531:338-703(+)